MEYLKYIKIKNNVERLSYFILKSNDQYHKCYSCSFTIIQFFYIYLLRIFIRGKLHLQYDFCNKDKINCIIIYDKTYLKTLIKHFYRKDLIFLCQM